MHGDLLRLALQGEAQMFYGGQTEIARRDYDAAIAKLEKTMSLRFSKPGFSVVERGSPMS